MVWAIAGAAVEQGDNDEALARVAEARALFAEIDDAEGLALCGFLEASLAPLDGDLDRFIYGWLRAGCPRHRNKDIQMDD